MLVQKVLMVLMVLLVLLVLLVLREAPRVPQQPEPARGFHSARVPQQVLAWGVRHGSALMRDADVRLCRRLRLPAFRELR